jgi:hypothetical protein
VYSERIADVRELVREWVEWSSSGVGEPEREEKGLWLLEFGFVCASTGIVNGGTGTRFTTEL